MIELNWNHPLYNAHLELLSVLPRATPLDKPCGAKLSSIEADFCFGSIRDTQLECRQLQRIGFPVVMWRDKADHIRVGISTVGWAMVQAATRKYLELVYDESWTDW